MSADPSHIEKASAEQTAPALSSLRLMALPARERLGAILDHPDPGAMVASMPAQDFYFTVMAVGPDDALPLLALARARQLNFVADLQWWQGDRLAPAAAIAWLDRLHRASPRNLLLWLYRADFELLVALFKKWLRVAVPPEGVDPVEARDLLPPLTLDEAFYWEAVYPQYEDLLASILRYLFEAHHGFYRELMHHTVWQVEDEAEESAYRFRLGRLEDLGIPDPYDALEIYRAMRVQDLAFGKTPPPESAGAGPVSFAVACQARNDLLTHLLQGIDDPAVLSTLQWELAALGNKVVVADGLPLDEALTLAEAVDKVSAYVSLGLELASRRDSRTAAALLREVFLEHLFRLGHSHLAKIRRRLRRVHTAGWISQWPAGWCLLERRWMEAVQGLLARTPRVSRDFFDAQVAPQKPVIPRTVGDLKLAKRLVDVILALGPLFHGLPCDAKRLVGRLWQEGQTHLLEEVTLAKLLWTAAGNLLSAGKWAVEPLPADRWRDIWPRLGSPAVERCIRAWTAAQVLDPRQRRLAEAYLAPLWRAYAEEFAAFTATRLPDPRYVEFFLFTRG